MGHSTSEILRSRASAEVTQPLTRDDALSIRVVDDPAAFAALGPAWDALLGRCARATAFLTHEWFDAAWQWRGLSAGLHVMCLYRRAELIGVLPLVLERSSDRGRWVRRLELLTVPDTQLCDLIVPDTERSVAAAAFADALAARQRDWDVLRLAYLSDESAAMASFRDAMQARRFSVSVNRTADNPYVALDTTWDAYYATRSRRLKKSNNLNANRLKKAGEVTIERLAPGAGDAADVQRMVDVVTAISARSWKTETGNSLDQPGPQAFIRRLSESAHRRGWLSIWLVSLDGQPLAMEYQLVADGAVYALRSDFDVAQEAQNVSPGSVLSHHLLQQLFAQGLERYFMGPGNNAYKYRWTEQSTPTHEMTVYARSLRGRLVESWEAKLKPAIRKLRDRGRVEEPANTAGDEDADDAGK